MLDLSHDKTPADVGGRLAFAVMNTVHWRRSAAPIDDLKTYDTLLAVSSLSGLVASPGTLALASADDPDAAYAVYLKAIELREAAYATFDAQLSARQLRPASFVRLQEGLNGVLTELQLTDTCGKAKFAWKRPDNLELPYWLLVLSACALLTNDADNRIRICPGKRCGWIFWDETMNRSRRWCSGGVCGNRARVEKYYARKRNVKGL
jgi:predicted RNA-binding Zn ribbon-like protein